MLADFRASVEEGTGITLDVDKGLVVIDATSQGNAEVRAGPLPPANAAGGWHIHAYVDHCIVEVIVNNMTALVVYAAPQITSSQVGWSGLQHPHEDVSTLDVWALASANE